MFNLTLMCVRDWKSYDLVTILKRSVHVSFHRILYILSIYFNVDGQLTNKRARTISEVNLEETLFTVRFSPMRIHERDLRRFTIGPLSLKALAHLFFSSCLECERFSSNSMCVLVLCIERANINTRVAGYRKLLRGPYNFIPLYFSRNVSKGRNDGNRVTKANFLKATLTLIMWNRDRFRPKSACQITWMP